jgi:flagellar motor switch protein FliN/FliY
VANEKDDDLDPAEIEALLNSAGQEVPPLSGAQIAAGNQPLTHGDIGELLKEQSQSARPGNPEALLESAAASLEAAIAPDSGPFGEAADPASRARPFEFQAFDRSGESQSSADLGNLKDVELNLRIELGRTELLIEEVLKLREGSVVALDKLAGDPVDILVNGRLIARGEVLVLNDNFCVRVAEILAPALVSNPV